MTEVQNGLKGRIFVCGTWPLSVLSFSSVNDLEEGLSVFYKNFMLPRAHGKHCQYSDINR